MHNNFKAISLSYKNSPVEIRELLTFDELSAKNLLHRIEECTSINEALVVSTCNRTEIYYTSPTDQSELIFKLIAFVKGIDKKSCFTDYFQMINKNDDACRHLFRVGVGLESQVVGDIQIINQIKKAYQWSADENMAGPFLHRLMHTIFYTNKRVVQETVFRDGAASVSYATVELIEGLISHLTKPNILVLGLGEIGEDVARNLENIKDKEVVICNRSLDKASVLAEELGYQVVPFDAFQEAVLNADVIISSVGVEKPLITKSLFNTKNRVKHQYLFDLSVPRSVEQDIETLEGLILYNIDSIQSTASKVLEKRIAAIPDVESIVESALVEFDNWSHEMEVSPIINKLKNALEEIRQNEIARYVKKLSDKESQLVDMVTKNMMQKVIKLPVLQLKAACKKGEADSLIELLNDLFDLEKQTEKISK